MIESLNIAGIEIPVFYKDVFELNEIYKEGEQEERERIKKLSMHDKTVSLLCLRFLSEDREYSLSIDSFAPEFSPQCRA